MLPDLAALEHFHFLRPAWALLLLPWLLIAIAQRRRQEARDMFGGIIAPHLLEHLRLRRFDSRWINPRSFSWVIVLLLLVVLMGPSWRQQPSPLSQDEAPLVVLLDVSASMQQRDIQPSRLRRAKQKVSDLLALRPDTPDAPPPAPQLREEHRLGCPVAGLPGRSRPGAAEHQGGEVWWAQLDLNQRPPGCRPGTLAS